MKNININYIYFILLFIIIIFFYINNFLNIKEYFCKIPKYNNQDEINDKRVLLDYEPQSNIKTSSCNQYWKEWPFEYNNDLVEPLPNTIYSDQLFFPIEKQFANKQYQAGLIDFNKLAALISEATDNIIFDESSELLIDPLTKEKLEFKYQLKFSYFKLNQITFVNRWENYNPETEVIFNYDDIKSPIEELNILNNKFKDRCNILQKKLLTKEQLILFGLINFQIFKYRILYINYLNNDINKPIYVIEIYFYRFTDYYINTFSYMGYFKDKKPYLINVKFIGRESTDKVLLSNPYNNKAIKQQIINSNFSNDSILDQDPDSVVEITKKHMEQYKIKNQYACFNLDYKPTDKYDNMFLPFYSLETCESSYDRYGKQKKVGLLDKPCKIDTDCPFYKINKNYENNFGGCKSDGFCELPTNMKPLGYRYFEQKNKPLCYNCESDKFEVMTTLDTCCDDQFDKKKYPFLKSPDYSFLHDNLERTNFFNNKFCKTKPNSLKLECENIII